MQRPPRFGCTTLAISGGELGVLLRTVAKPAPPPPVEPYFTVHAPATKLLFVVPYGTQVFVKSGSGWRSFSRTLSSKDAKAFVDAIFSATAYDAPVFDSVKVGSVKVLNVKGWAGVYGKVVPGGNAFGTGYDIRLLSPQDNPWSKTGYVYFPGKATVVIGGKTYRLSKQIDDLLKSKLPRKKNGEPDWQLLAQGLIYLALSFTSWLAGRWRREEPGGPGGLAVAVMGVSDLLGAEFVNRWFGIAPRAAVRVSVPLPAAPMTHPGLSSVARSALPTCRAGCGCIRQRRSPGPAEGPVGEREQREERTAVGIGRAARERVAEALAEPPERCRADGGEGERDARPRPRQEWGDDEERRPESERDARGSRIESKRRDRDTRAEHRPHAGGGTPCDARACDRTIVFGGGPQQQREQRVQEGGARRSGDRVRSGENAAEALAEPPHAERPGDRRGEGRPDGPPRDEPDRERELHRREQRIQEDRVRGDDVSGPQLRPRDRRGVPLRGRLDHLAGEAASEHERLTLEGGICEPDGGEREL